MASLLLRASAAACALALSSDPVSTNMLRNDSGETQDVLNSRNRAFDAVLSDFL
jgi:hypothetical protein